MFGCPSGELGAAHCPNYARVQRSSRGIVMVVGGFHGLGGVLGGVVAARTWLVVVAILPSPLAMLALIMFRRRGRDIEAVRTMKSAGRKIDIGQRQVSDIGAHQ